MKFVPFLAFLRLYRCNVNKFGGFSMKKHEQFKKLLCVALTAACISAVNIPVSATSTVANIADSDIVSPQNIAITVMARNLTYVSSGVLECYAQTSTTIGYYAGVTVELQQYDGGWDTIKTYVGSAEMSFVYDREVSVTSGYKYRLKVTHRAMTSSGTIVEEFVKYSDEVSC